MTHDDDRAEVRARLIDLMTPGRAVSAVQLRDAGLDLSPDLMRRISRASRAAADDADVLIAADEISAGLTTKGGSHGRERAARALRLAVTGRDRPAAPRNKPADKEPTAPSVTPQAQSREDRLAARLAALGAQDLDGSPIDSFDPRSNRR